MVEKVKEMMLKYSIPEELIYGNYYAKHRYYHDMNHIYNLLEKADSRGLLTEDFFLAILFHDVIYDPKRNDNEERSANASFGYLSNDNVKQAILDTKTHKPTCDLGYVLCELDMEELYGDFTVFMTNGNNVAKEYQFIDWAVYKKARCKFLTDNNVNPLYIEVVNSQTPKIAVYPGSFNPWHKGHMNILQKAEKIFDKVIIARGVNPDKTAVVEPLPRILENRQIEKYNGLLTDFIGSLSYDVTVIRGLRNATDLEYELNQYRFLQDLRPNINVVSIFCDKEYEHISSSAIKVLQRYGKGNDYLVK
jgi:pantetheine-phosphate adenylyltransferase